MKTREKEKEHYSYLYENKYDGLEECYQPTLEEAFEAGIEKCLTLILEENENR